MKCYQDCWALLISECVLSEQFHVAHYKHLLCTWIFISAFKKNIPFAWSIDFLCITSKSHAFRRNFYFFQITNAFVLGFQSVVTCALCTFAVFSPIQPDGQLKQPIQHWQLQQMLSLLLVFTDEKNEEREMYLFPVLLWSVSAVNFCLF